MYKPLNVFGEPLEPCSLDPMTGFYRDGSCNSGIDNPALHTICILVTEAFLEFSKANGNDLSTPIPEYKFRGLKAGDRWCLAAGNFFKAYKAGKAPKVFLRATHQVILEYISIDALQEFALDM